MISKRSRKGLMLASIGRDFPISICSIHMENGQNQGAGTMIQNFWGSIWVWAQHVLKAFVLVNVDEFPQIRSIAAWQVRVYLLKGRRKKHLWNGLRGSTVQLLGEICTFPTLIVCSNFLFYFFRTMLHPSFWLVKSFSCGGVGRFYMHICRCFNSKHLLVKSMFWLDNHLFVLLNHIFFQFWVVFQICRVQLGSAQIRKRKWCGTTMAPEGWIPFSDNVLQIRPKIPQFITSFFSTSHILWVSPCPEWDLVGFNDIKDIFLGISWDLMWDSVGFHGISWGFSCGIQPLKFGSIGLVTSPPKPQFTQQHQSTRRSMRRQPWSCRTSGAEFFVMFGMIETGECHSTLDIWERERYIYIYTKNIV